MDAQVLKNILEAALLAAGRPLKIEQLLDLFEEPRRPSRAEVRQALSSLQEDYEHRGIRLTEVANGFRVQVGPEMTDALSRLWQERPPRYSRATLETLALIAYRQPITRGEIEEVRGVSVSSNIMRNLLERNWIRIVGHRDVPGRPGLYATTRDFLDYFGLKSLDELPPLTELKDFDNLTVEMDLSAPDEQTHLRAVPDQDEDEHEPRTESDEAERDEEESDEDEAEEDEPSSGGEVESLQAATGDTTPVKCLTQDQARMSPEAFETSTGSDAAPEENEPETLASKGLS